MTKKAMIQEIQRQEAALFLELKQATKAFGADSSFTNRRRSEYATIYQLMRDLNIPVDLKLPDNEAAMQLMLEC